MAAKLVMAFGSFDLLHPGHLHYLEKAAAMGDSLIVIVARDDSIRRIKGRAPVMDQKSRALMVGSLKCVDKAIVGKKIRKTDDFYKVLKEYHPSVIAFGYDQKVDIPRLKRWLDENSIHAKVIRIRSPLNPLRYKSTRLREHLNSN